MNGPGHSFIMQNWGENCCGFWGSDWDIARKAIVWKGSGQLSWKREFRSLLRLFGLILFHFQQQPTPLSSFGGRTLARTGLAFLTNLNWFARIQIGARHHVKSSLKIAPSGLCFWAVFGTHGSWFAAAPGTSCWRRPQFGLYQFVKKLSIYLSLGNLKVSCIIWGMFFQIFLIILSSVGVLVWRKKVRKPESGGDATYMRDRRLEKVESKKEIVSEKVQVGFGGKTVISLMGNQSIWEQLSNNATQSATGINRWSGNHRRQKFWPFCVEYFLHNFTFVLLYFWSAIDYLRLQSGGGLGCPGQPRELGV